MLKISDFYLDKQKNLIPKKIWSVPCTMDSSFFSQQMPYCLATLLALILGRRNGFFFCSPQISQLPSQDFTGGRLGNSLNKFNAPSKLLVIRHLCFNKLMNSVLVQFCNVFITCYHESWIYKSFFQKIFYVLFFYKVEV